MFCFETQYLFTLKKTIKPQITVIFKEYQKS
jgi:hypothetical protein